MSWPQNTHSEVAVAVVVGAGVRAFLSRMQWHMGGIDVQYQVLRRLAVADNKLIELHLM